jgi:hypothetical protein
MTTTLKPMPRIAASTSLGLIHRSSNRALRRALEELPPWTAARDKLALIDASAPQHPAMASLRDNAVAIIRDGLDAGAGVPADLAEKMAHAHAVIEVETEARAAIEQVRADLSNELTSAVVHDSATLYRSLDEQLQEIVSEVRRLGDTSALGSAENAVAADRVDEYRRLGDIAARYSAVRMAQSMLLRHVGGGTETSYPEALHIRDVRAAWEHYRPWRSRGYLVDTATGNRRNLAPPWPDDPRGVDFLCWAVASDVALWVPTPAELTQAASDLDSWVTENAPERLSRVEERVPSSMKARVS